MNNMDKLIFALDVPNFDEARKIVKILGDQVIFYKIGLELFSSDEYFKIASFLRENGKKIFADLKFFDIPKTVGRSVRNIVANSRPDFITVHGDDNILKAAIEERGDSKILSVTMLTSINQYDMESLGFQCNLENLVISRAKRAFELGCDGVISSGLEVQNIRSQVEISRDFLVVTPGIRLSEFQDVNSSDQKRTITPFEAIKNGASYIVVGRPIKDSKDPYQTAKNIQNEIETALKAK